MTRDASFPADGNTAALAATQLLFARAVTSPQGGTADDVLPAIVPGGTLDAAGALAVYREGYLARLSEQLGETYESVWRVVGDEAFRSLCESYIAGHPSTSYNLSDYGRDFAGFLEGESITRAAGFLPELARFELVFHDLFHAPAHESIDARELASLSDLSGVRFRLGSAVRLLACEHAVYDVFRHRNDAEAPDLDLERPQYVLLFKQHGEVLARETDAPTHAALDALLRGKTVDEAIECAVARDASWDAPAVAKLFELVAVCGLVVAVER